MANSRKDGYACRETQDRSICFPGAEATAETFNPEILTNCCEQSGDNQERMKFLGAIVMGGGFQPSCKLFSLETQLGSHREDGGKPGESSPSGAV